MTRARQSPPRRTRQPKPGVLEQAWPWIVRFVGIAIILYETVLEQSDRPSLLLLAAYMVGLAEFVRLVRGEK